MIRWVASHAINTEKILDKHQYILENVENILERNDNTPAGIRDGQEIVDFLKNKNALVTMAFQIDIQGVFKVFLIKSRNCKVTHMLQQRIFNEWLW